MTLKSNADFAVARYNGMNAHKARQLAQKHREADDLYVICPKCNAKLQGTLEEVQKLHEEHDCATAST